MHRPLMRRIACLLAFPIGLGAAAACSSGADRAGRPDSMAPVMGAMGDTLDAQGSLASDATLIIQTSPELQASLRAVADSFATREAIRVVFSAPPEGATDRPLGISPTADLVVVSGDVAPRLPGDSTAWTLPFAESLPDSAAIAASDSVRRADSVRTSGSARRARRATGRRADSIRLDSVRRARALQDSLRASRARADSARTLVLTVPALAPNSAVAERFVRYLLTEGRATLLRSGLHVLPILALRGEAAPPGIAALVDTIIPLYDIQKADSIPRP